MNRAQVYIDSMFESISQEQYSYETSQSTVLQVKAKIAGAMDLDAELKTLYKVEGFADCAMYLMWLARLVEEDPSKLEPSEDETQAFSQFIRTALGEAPQEPPVIQETVPTEETAFEMPAPESTPAAEEQPTFPEQASAGFGGVDVPSSLSELAFPPLLETFVEAMQHGDDKRLPLMEELLNRCSALSGSLDEPEDFRQLCEELETFLKYIREKEYMDDVRVMNILSNISGTVDMWNKADAGAREGFLTEGIEVLRDFKTHFE